MAYKHPFTTMKKMFVLLFILFFTDICAAQAPLSVLGINPNTTMKKFNLALSKKGIRPTQTAAGLYEYRVKYAGYPNCRMEVIFNIGNDSVRKVTIEFSHESIAKDKTIFENITKQFKEKYGHETDLGEALIKLKEEYEGHRIRRTRSNRQYGQVKINYCEVNWYYDDDEYEDGVDVKYYTNARDDNKVSVSSDI